MERSSISINGVADLPPNVVRGQFPKQEEIVRKKEIQADEEDYFCNR